MELTGLLGFFNLTHQEATLYLLLCSEGRLTGYEAAKLSGISRSNTYTALASLVEKGAAWMEEETAVRYIPVPVEEFCENRLRKMREYGKVLSESVPSQREDAAGYLTVKGDKNIMDKMKNIIGASNERVYLVVDRGILRQLSAELEDAVKRKLKVVIITEAPFELFGAQVYHTRVTEGQIRLIADSHYVLTGDISESSESTCLYSQKRNLVDLFKESLKNEIELIKAKQRG